MLSKEVPLELLNRMEGRWALRPGKPSQAGSRVPYRWELECEWGEGRSVVME